MDLTAGESIIYRGHPSWRATLGLYIKGLLVCVLLGAITAAVTAISEDEVNVGWVVLVAGVALAVVLVVGYVKRMATEYTITTRRLHIRRGILNRTTEETRVDRVQNTHTSQSVLERLLKVGTVDFDVASDERAGLFKFSGVESPQEVVQAIDRATTAADRADPAVDDADAAPPQAAPPGDGVS